VDRGTLLLVWVVFSVILGTLYYRLITAKTPVGTKTRQSISRVIQSLKMLPNWILTGVFRYTPVHQKDEAVAQSRISAWQEWPEWTVIIISIWVYCLPFLDLGLPRNLPGSEFESFKAFDQILEFSLKSHGEFPLWNPFFYTGLPYTAHPMLHAYNPFISIPVMLFGALDGFKIAVFLGFVIAGLGMWWLGKEIGLTPTGRIWISLMYTFSGVAAAKFIQGQYLMVLAFGWIPFSLAAIIAATRSRQRKYIYAAAIGLALLFLSGNAYYAYYMLYVIALYAVITIPKFERNPLKLKIDREDIKVLVAIGVLSLGLIAIQLLPALEYRDQYLKALNTDLTDSRSLRDIVLDFTSPDPFRPGGFSDELRPEEFYAYTGWWPFIGVLFTPIVWRTDKKRYLVLFLALFIFTLAWIDVKDMPWRNIFQQTPFLFQFRYPSRMVVIGALSIVTAAGLGLDGLLQKKFQDAGDKTPENNLHRLKNTLLSLAICIFMVWSVRDLALTTRPLLHTVSYDEGREQIVEWLRKFDPGLYYVTAPNGWHAPMIGNEMHYRNIWDSISILPRYDNQISERVILAEPKYEILTNDNPTPDNSFLIKSFDTVSIYQRTDSLPFVFTISESTLNTLVEGNLRIDEVTPVTSFVANINDMEGDVESDSTRALILLSTFSPGWQLTVDGNPRKIYNAYGFMAAEVDKGSHHYQFVYRPVWFFVGLVISLTTLLIMAGNVILHAWQNMLIRRKKSREVSWQASESD
jgi:hypothetical protein